MKNISHSELWINTEYFIKAFRSMCSLMYLSEHYEICQFINAKEFIDGKLHRFYINLCALVDIHCNYAVERRKRSSYKKMLKVMCPSFNWIFYERDKDAAHKDCNYVYKMDKDICDLIVKMKKCISTTKDICSNIMINTIQYYYYSYDHLLFRYVNGITPKLEKIFNDSIRKHKQFDKKKCIEITNISDARQVRNLDLNKKYGVVFKRGLFGQPYDMIENSQDSWIKANVLFKYDCWPTIKKDGADKMSALLLEILDKLKTASILTISEECKKTL